MEGEGGLEQNSFVQLEACLLKLVVREKKHNKMRGREISCQMYPRFCSYPGFA